MTSRYYIALVFCVLSIAGNLNAQDSVRAIQITSGGQVLAEVRQYTEFKFQGADGQHYKGKIKIYNDSQFAFYNYFNELSNDTMHISFVESILLKGEAQRYKIHPPLVVVGLIFTPLVTIPVVLYKLLAKKQTRHWVIREEFSIKVVTLNEY